MGREKTWSSLLVQYARFPVAGPVDSFRIGANALAGGTGSGTIRINGVPLTSSTPLTSLTGSLIAVQSGGVVKIGQ